ncbi:CBS domain-containing protein [Saccharothrix violaceirubra]|uniref:CBS domain-containing protein n=1 Tax=Saccharothrix violaceirubra TaxID=413306 RepID=A0A7W7T6U2_9PSEU|nr:CBS domain-containing protein [Saccharothrix violaceirubra]MBB4967643.1 CBS domain-containing protein [Saccharothrix violaceirubra]
MRIADVLRAKGSRVETVDSTASVAELVSALAAHNVGALVVVADGTVAGIVSERDVVRHLGSRGGGLLTDPVASIMTTDLYTCTSSDTVDTLTVHMTERRVRHVPVLDDGELVGIVSIGDVVKSRIDQLEAGQEHLAAYIAQG